MSATEAFIEELAERVAAKVHERRQDEKNPNELMRVAAIAKELRVSREIVRGLIRNGTLPQAPDIREMRVKRSEVNAYATKR